jgi:hypothetical protein
VNKQRKKPASAPNAETVDMEAVIRIEEVIRRRAYELYEARGREDGHDLEDWFRAETEIAQNKSRAIVA